MRCPWESCHPTETAIVCASESRQVLVVVVVVSKARNTKVSRADATVRAGDLGGLSGPTADAPGGGRGGTGDVVGDGGGGGCCRGCGTDATTGSGHANGAASFAPSSRPQEQAGSDVGTAVTQGTAGSISGLGAHVGSARPSSVAVLGPALSSIRMGSVREPSPCQCDGSSVRALFSRPTWPGLGRLPSP